MPYNIPSNWSVQTPNAMFGVGNYLGGQLGQSYQSAYDNALQQNTQLYNNIMSGYQSIQQSQQAEQQKIQQGWTNLQNQVLGDIQGVDASQRQAIKDQYAQQSGSAMQSLINRGLGNSTITSSVQRGIDLDRAKAETALSNQMAQLTAGYRSQLGSAGLGYQNEANMQNTALGTKQLDFMNTITARYPDLNAYAGLANMMRQQTAPGMGGSPGSVSGLKNWKPMDFGQIPWDPGTYSSGGNYGGGYGGFGLGSYGGSSASQWEPMSLDEIFNGTRDPNYAYYPEASGAGNLYGQGGYEDLSANELTGYQDPAYDYYYE